MSLVEVRRTLLYAATEVFRRVGWHPHGLDPPRGPRLCERTHDGSSPLGIFPRRLALPYDVEGTVRSPVLVDVLFYLPDGLGRYVRRSSISADRGRKYTIIA